MESGQEELHYPLGNNSPFADSITYSYRIENISPTGQK